MESKQPTLYCSFCGKSQHEVRQMIAGPEVFICDECVVLCLEVTLPHNCMAALDAIASSLSAGDAMLIPPHEDAHLLATAQNIAAVLGSYDRAQAAEAQTLIAAMGDAVARLPPSSNNGALHNKAGALKEALLRSANDVDFAANALLIRRFVASLNSPATA